MGDPPRSGAEYDRLEVELKVEERVRLNGLNARLRRLGIQTALRPVQSKPKAPQPSRVIQHPAPAIRRARNLDEELLEMVARRSQRTRQRDLGAGANGAAGTSPRGLDRRHRRRRAGGCRRGSP